MILMLHVLENIRSIILWVRILVWFTIYHRLLIGRDGYLDQSEAYDVYANKKCRWSLHFSWIMGFVEYSWINWNKMIILANMISYQIDWGRSAECRRRIMITEYAVT